MYTKGDARIGSLGDDLEYLQYTDDPPESGKLLAYLPHSFDYWVIGGQENVIAMISDLQAILAEMDREEVEK